MFTNGFFLNKSLKHQEELPLDIMFLRLYIKNAQDTILITLTYLFFISQNQQIVSKSFVSILKIPGLTSSDKFVKVNCKSTICDDVGLRSIFNCPQLFLNSSHPKKGDIASKTQGIIGIEREQITLDRTGNLISNRK